MMYTIIKSKMYGCIKFMYHLFTDTSSLQNTLQSIALAIFKRKTLDANVL